MEGVVRYILAEFKSRRQPTCQSSLFDSDLPSLFGVLFKWATKDEPQALSTPHDRNIPFS
jgi:hypothetical protein